MALRAYTPERREVSTSKGQVLADVRGLSLEDVSVLIREHLPDLEALVDLFRNDEARAAMSAKDYGSLFLPVITQAPGFVANVIALAADEPNGAKKIQDDKWPLSVQVAAIAVVWELTVSEIGEVKKLLGIVTALREMKAKGKGITKAGTKAR